MTNYDGLKLSSKQLKALPTFIAAKSVEEACKDIGISRNCYYEWLKEPHFRTALNNLREELVLDGIGQLKAGAIKAALTLYNLMDRDDCPSVQRAAANDVLNHIVKFKELQELEKRLDEVERLISKQEGKE